MEDNKVLKCGCGCGKVLISGLYIEIDGYKVANCDSCLIKFDYRICLSCQKPFSTYVPICSLQCFYDNNLSKNFIREHKARMKKFKQNNPHLYRKLSEKFEKKSIYCNIYKLKNGSRIIIHDFHDTYFDVEDVEGRYLIYGDKVVKIPKIA